MGGSDTETEKEIGMTVDRDLLLKCLQILKEERANIHSAPLLRHVLTSRLPGNESDAVLKSPLFQVLNLLTVDDFITLVS